MANSDELEETYHSWASAEAGSNEEQRQLDNLLKNAAVQIRRVVSRVSATVTTGCERSDLEDVCGNAMLKLYKIMLRWSNASSDERPPILKPYVNQIARNAFQDLMRERNPSWFTMGGKVLWKLRHSPRFVLSDEDEYRLCALTETQAARPENDRARIEAATADLRRNTDWSRTPLEQLLEALLSAVGQPIPFDALADLSLQCMGGERSMRSLDDEVAPGLPLLEMIADGASNPEQEIQDAEILRWAWDQIGELPENQRKVCGLNLEAAVGTRLEIFVLRGVADRPKYEVLIRKLFLSDLPSVPPLADPEIGRLLHTDVKRVSNARISSQRRLARRFLQKQTADGSNSHGSPSWVEGAQTRS